MRLVRERLSDFRVAFVAGVEAEEGEREWEGGKKGEGIGEELPKK